MAYFDSRTARALDDLENGQGESLAQLFEEGRTMFLHEYLRDRPDLCERIAKAIRGKSIRSQGERKNDTTERDTFLLSRICYWLGADADGWQDGAGDTAIHRAAEEWQGEKRISADSIKSHLWYGRQPSLVCKLHMTSKFCKGCEDIADQQGDIEAFVKRKLFQAKELDLLPTEYSHRLVGLFLHK